MFTDEELKDYENDFNQLEVFDKEERKQILEFIYSFALMAYESSKC